MRREKFNIKKCRSVVLSIKNYASCNTWLKYHFSRGIEYDIPKRLFKIAKYKTIY